jgi:acyl carrier protein
MAVEKEFELEIPDAAAEKMLTVEDLHVFLVVDLKRLGREGDSAQVFERMRASIVRQLDVSPGKVTSSARFVKDLHAD